MNKSSCIVIYKYSGNLNEFKNIQLVSNSANIVGLMHVVSYKKLTIKFFPKIVSKCWNMSYVTRIPNIEYFLSSQKPNYFQPVRSSQVFLSPDDTLARMEKSTEIATHISLPGQLFA